MTTRRKLVLASLGAAVIVFGAPVAWSALGTRGYFREGRCACGNDIFVRILGNGYFSYSPGHEVPEHRKFTVRRNSDGWDIMGLPHSDMYWSPLEGEDKVIGHLRFRGGALYESWGSSTNWMRLSRAYNVWGIWAAKLLKK
jgi:hypothetical protein